MLVGNQNLRNYLNLTVSITFSTGPLKGSTGTCCHIKKKICTYRSSYMHMHLCSFIRDIAMKIIESEYWREALRSCHFVVEDPPTQHSSHGLPPAVNPQGLPAVNPQGPPPAVNSQGPPAVNSQGPPAVNLQGPFPAVNLQGLLTINSDGASPVVNQDGPPPAVNPDSNSPAVNPDGPAPAVNPDGPPSVNPPGIPPAKIIFYQKAPYVCNST